MLITIVSMYGISNTSHQIRYKVSVLYQIQSIRYFVSDLMRCIANTIHWNNCNQHEVASLLYIYIYIYVYRYIYIYTQIYHTCLYFRSPHSRSGGLETFLAPSAGNQTGEGDIVGATGVLRKAPKCSNCEQLGCIMRRWAPHIHSHIT